MASKIDSYTVDNLAKSSDEAVIKEAVAAIRTKVRNEARTAQRTLIAAAYATRAALANEVFSKTDLAKQWAKPQEDGTMKDLSVSTVTLYDRLGLAAVNLGIEPRNVRWMDNQSVFVWGLLGGKGGATISEVGKYIEAGLPTAWDKDGKVTARDGKPSQEGLLDLLTDYFDPTGAALKGDVRRANEAKRRYNLMVAAGVDNPIEPEVSTDGEGQNLTPENEQNPVARVEVALNDARTHIALLDAEQFKAAYSVMASFVEFVDAEVAKRQPAKKASKRTAS